MWLPLCSQFYANTGGLWVFFSFPFSFLSFSFCLFVKRTAGSLHSSVSTTAFSSLSWGNLRKGKLQTYLEFSFLWTSPSICLQVDRDRPNVWEDLLFIWELAAYLVNTAGALSEEPCYRFGVQLFVPLLVCFILTGYRWKGTSVCLCVCVKRIFGKVK